MQHVSGVAAEPAATFVGVGQKREAKARRFHVQPLLQDAFHGPVRRRAMLDGAPAGRFQPFGSVFLLQPQDALCRPEVVQDPRGKQLVHEFTAHGTDALGVFQAPLRRLHEVGPGLRGQMLVHGGFASRPAQPGVDGHQSLAVEDLHGLFPGAQPKMLVHQRKRGGIEGLLELDVAVAMELDPGPGHDLRSHVGKRPEEMALRLGKTRQRPLMGGAVDTVAGRAHDPLQQLAVGVGDIPEVTQGQEVVLDVLDPGLDDSLFLGVSWRTRGDEEAVALGYLGIGPLYLWIMVAGLGDGALGVVDDNPRRDAAEELEGPAVAAKPGLDLLVPDHLGVLVPAPGQGHDEDPGPEHFSCAEIDDLRSCAEIHLGHIAGCVVEHNRGRPLLLVVSQEAFDRVVAAGEGELPDQRLVDRRPGNALSRPGQDLVRKGEDLGLSAFCWGRLSGQPLDNFVVGQRRILVQPALILSQQTELARLGPAHKAGRGNLAVGLTQAHPGDNVTNFMHCEPPVGHPFLLDVARGVDSPSRKSERRLETMVARLTRPEAGSISPPMGWPH